MCRSALPEHMQGPVEEVWKGTDNDSWLMRLKKRVQYKFIHGPRCKHKWREYPITLFAYRGKGDYRIESSDGQISGLSLLPCKFLFNHKYFDQTGSINSIGFSYQGYISRIQPWARWGIVLQWPLFLNCWFIYRKKDVVSPPRYKSDFGITKMFTFHIGYKRDSDKIYWPTMYIGGNFE